MGPPGYSPCNMATMAYSSRTTEELEKDPEEEKDKSGYLYDLEKEENGHQGNYPGIGE